MAIMEIQSVFVKVGSWRPGSTAGKTFQRYAASCGSADNKWCYVQLAFEGSIFNDDYTPTFTYPGRQEAFGCWYDTTQTLYNKLKNALETNWSHLLFWERAYNITSNGCKSLNGDTISVKEAVQKLMLEYPNNIHVVPNGTNTHTYLTNFVPYDPCEGVVCDNICKDYDLHSQKCVDGTCAPDALLETNSPQCGYNPCEGIICNDICKEHDLHSQKCVDGACVPDALLETNALQCGFIPPVTIIPRKRTYWIKSTLPVFDLLPGLPYIAGIPILPGFTISDKVI